MAFETSLTEPELVVEVRDALAGLDETKIPEDTILQQYERFVVPKLESLLDNKNPTDAQVDAIVVFWTAEQSFKSWFTKKQMMFGDVQIGVDPGSYQEELETRTNEALNAAGVERDLEGSPVPFVERTDGMLR